MKTPKMPTCFAAYLLQRELKHFSNRVQRVCRMGGRAGVPLKIVSSFPLLSVALLLGWTAASCAVEWDTDRTELPEQPSEVAAMLDEAESSQPERTAQGWLIRSLSSAGEMSVDEWIPAHRPLEIEIDEAGLAMSVRTARHGSIRVATIGPDRQGGRAEIDGASIVRRDRAGRIASMMFPRPGGIEDLIVQRERGEVVGYELELPVGWTLRQPEGYSNLVEIRDPRHRTRLRIVAPRAWDEDGVRWAPTAHIDGPRVLFSVAPEAKGTVTIDPEWQDGGTPSHVRSRATSTLLQDGKVLVIGGVLGNDEVLVDVGETLCSTEIFDPLELTWEAGPVVPGPSGECYPLMDHVAVPLNDGRVLVTGGANRNRLLGANQPAAFADAWIFDPRAREFTRVGQMQEPRVHHTATALRSGKVLITGGMDRMTPLYEAGYKCPEVGGERCRRCTGTTTAELFDPATGTFSPLTMPVPRACHTATLLADDSVLLVGGGGEPEEYGTLGLVGAPVGTLTHYKDGAFEQLETKLNVPRFGHVAVLRPDSNLLFVGYGRTALGLVGPPVTEEPIAEVLDVGNAPGGLFSTSPAPTATPVVCDSSQSSDCPNARAYPAAVLVRNGDVLIVGGQENELNQTKPSNEVDAFDFDASSFRSPKPAALLSVVSKPALSVLPTGKVMLVGQTAPCQLIDDTSYEFVGAAALSVARGWHSATLLPDGKILVAGGSVGTVGLTGADAVRDSAELFDPATMTNAVLPAAMTSRRLGHSATLLPGFGNGPDRVLLVGGLATAFEGPGGTLETTPTAEVYDPASQTFTAVGSMSIGRAFHSATRLADGRVLIVGGTGDGLEALPASAEVFDPVANTFTSVAAPLVGRLAHTATLLPSGKVLIAGGFSHQGIAPFPTGELASAELFDPVQNAFEPLPSMTIPRGLHTASPLPDGRVLLVGGTVATAAEIFDPVATTFVPTVGVMSARRISHAASVLPNGKVLISGGASSFDDPTPRADAEIYDPVSEQFTQIEPTVDIDVRWDHESVLLLDGRVALIGGSTNQASDEARASVALIAPLGTNVDAASALLSGPLNASPGESYSVEGSALTGFWAASSGPYVSPTGAPIAAWVPLAGSPTLGVFAPWSDSSVEWSAPSTPYAGPGVLYAARHGQSSQGFYVEVARAPNGVACSDDAACESGFCSDGVCCNERCHVSGLPDAACRACSVEQGAEVDGVCSFVAAGEDPFEDCATSPECAPRFAVCGGDGSCMPCHCESALDCADGYVCTTSGSCELPPAVQVGVGCAVTSGAPCTDRTSWLVLAGAALARLRRRHSAVARSGTARLDRLS